MSGFASLADAARASFPERFCRVLEIREHDNMGYALFDTGPAGQPYLYGVNYERRDGRWFEGSSANGWGWSHVGSDPGRGTAAIWGAAPRSADRVRLEFRGVGREEEVRGGVFLAVWWSVACPTDLLDPGPQVTAFRTGGQWTRSGITE
jgi:hypothetical protein